MLEYWNDGLTGRRTIEYPLPDGMMEYWNSGIESA
jgi:hypothetical protein